MLGRKSRSWGCFFALHGLILSSTLPILLAMSPATQAYQFMQTEPRRYGNVETPSAHVMAPNPAHVNKEPVEASAGPPKNVLRNIFLLTAGVFSLAAIATIISVYITKGDRCASAGDTACQTLMPALPPAQKVSP